MATYKKMYGNKADCPKKPEEFSLKQNNLVDEQFASIEKNIKVDFRKIFKAKKPINLILTATSLGKTLGMAVWICKQLLSKEKKCFVWIRRYEKEFQSTVKPMFQNLLGKEAKVTLNGVFMNNKVVVYFIILNQYYNYKGLTGIADELQAIIFDEAIPLNKRYLDDEYKTEEEKFSDVINVVTRNRDDKPIYFLCNPNAKGAWIIQKWAPNYKPSNEKEKIETKRMILIYSMPWPQNKNRGIIKYLESLETKRINKEGLFPQAEDLFIINEKSTEYLYSFIIKGKEMEFGKRRNFYIIKEAENKEIEKKPRKKIIIFSRSDIIAYNNAILGDKKWYVDWWWNLIASRRLYFNSHTIRDHFIYNTSTDYRF